MFRKTVITCIVFLLLNSACMYYASVESSQADNQENNDDTVIIYGYGYPPIRAQSAAQARLMARRAAIIDAYRNALTSAGTKDLDERVFYSEIRGFVEGMTILDEEYLSDGSIRIRASVPAENITVISKKMSKKTRKSDTGPLEVTLDEWYRIIQEYVTFE